MVVLYNDVDIYPEISVNACIHDMYADKQADSVVLRFNDTRRQWDSWKPGQGDTLTVAEGAATTGLMYVKSVLPENGLYAMRAISIPLSSETPVNKAWEQIHLLQIAQDIASKHGLAFESYDVEDRFYPYLLQNGVQDFDFLQIRCTLEGCAFVVFDGTLILYGEAALESQTPAGSIQVRTDHDFEYQDRSANDYAKASLESGRYQGEFDAGIPSGPTLLPQRPIHVTSDSEAERYAKAILRDANKMNRSGHVDMAFSPEYAAGSVALLETAGEGSWDGPVFLHHVRHDYVKGRTRIFFRRPLEGY